MQPDSDLKELKRRLKKSNDYKNLTDTIAQLIYTQTRQDLNFMKKCLPMFKKLLSELVEFSFNSIKQAIESSLPRPLRHIRHITSVPRFNLKKNAENRLNLSSESGMIDPRFKDERKIVSEFSYVKGPAKFGKSIREIDKVRVPSPGPSCYYYDPLKGKARSPRIIFPKSNGDRSSYIPQSLSPGPNKYYSSIKCLAKHT